MARAPTVLPPLCPQPTIPRAFSPSRPLCLAILHRFLQARTFRSSPTLLCTEHGIRSAAILLTSSAPRYIVLPTDPHSACLAAGILFRLHVRRNLFLPFLPCSDPRPRFSSPTTATCTQTWAHARCLLGATGPSLAAQGRRWGTRRLARRDKTQIVGSHLADRLEPLNRSTARQSGAGGPLLTDRDSVVPGSLPTIRVVVVNLSSAGEVSAMPLSYPVLQLRYLCCCSTAGRLESTESMLTRSRVFG